MAVVIKVNHYFAMSGGFTMMHLLLSLHFIFGGRNYKGCTRSYHKFSVHSDDSVKKFPNCKGIVSHFREIVLVCNYQVQWLEYS